MATAAAATPSVPPPPPLSSRGIRVEDLKQIDITQLSQSELQALSLCSDSAFQVRRTDDVVSPHLDRSLFNESAGSRRQTYSRLHHRSHSRFPGLHPSLKPHRHPHSSSDPVSHSIVHFLKHFLNGNHNPPPPPPVPPDEATKSEAPPAMALGFPGLQEKLKIKRKRARKSKNLNKKTLLENGVGMELQQVNRKGEVVDFVELEKKGDELYSEELKRRTVGLETEEGVLGFLWGLEGQWCSRRKKRKYVDAGVFGDALPIGWKLLLGLRRRDYRVSVYCRRYVSPTGQQFMSCKEVASFLKSYFGGADQQKDQKTCSIQQTNVLSFEKNAIPADKTDDVAHDVVAHSALTRSSSNVHENDDCLMGIENLPEVQVQDIFECFKCNLTFEEKNLYLQHLFSFHQKTTKRYRFGVPVGEGVIIKDGKYECQFCHKVFQERRSYNGHVGIHVRNSGKSSNELSTPVNVLKNAESPIQEAVLPRSSKMDALIEIAQNSIFETSTVATGEQAITDHSASILSLEEAKAVSSDHEPNLSSHPVKIKAEDSNAEIALPEDLNHDGQVTTENNDVVRNDCSWDVSVKMDASCINDSEPARSSEIEKHGNSSLDMDYGNRCLKPSDGHLEDTPGLTVGEIVFQDGGSSVPLTQPFQFFPPFDSVSNKGQHEFSVVDQKLENVTGFEELRFDDIEPFKYGFVNGQELPSLPGSSMNLGSDSGIADGFNSSVRYSSEEVMLNTLETNQLTVCVWCRSEFKLEGIESETPSDSIGYMCPTCKAKISGHFSGGLSMDPHDF
ncbi:Methyl-CpG-binding domain-containing protein 8 [Sesamum alatum]|uniref:Methyl-CpG-binding domain-containing protein 8 n=1 Tax=Sesamum alatum TaxID=300844 RepID=A0AAE1YX11_9LAMI|nr:Methyl-CpG-binding domain-containing protein 8 [Sesamum alatum]